MAAQQQRGGAGFQNLNEPTSASARALLVATWRRSFVRSFVQSFVRSFVRSFVCSVLGQSGSRMSVDKGRRSSFGRRHFVCPLSRSLFHLLVGWFVRSFIRLLVRSLSFDAFIPHQSNLAVCDAVTNTVCSPKVGTVSGRVWMMTWDGGGAGVGNTEDDSSPGVLYSEA